jgi:hypothetical protein
MGKRLIRLKELCGPGGKLGVGRTKLDSDLVYNTERGGPQFVTGTAVPRLKLVQLGPRVLAAIEDEVDALIEALRAERDNKPPTPRLRPTTISREQVLLGVRNSHRREGTRKRRKPERRTPPA